MNDKVQLIKQADEKDCGVACVAMICQHFGKKLPLATIREAIKVDEYGASIYGLIDGAKKFDIKGTAFSGSAEDVWNAIAETPEVLPVIVRILNRGGFEHYSVVAVLKKGEMRLCDPDAGHVVMTKEQFENCFLGEIITFETTPNFKAENACHGQLSRFTNMLLKQKKLLTIIGILSLLVTLIGMASAYLFQFIVDGGIASLDSADKDYMLNTLIYMGGSLAIIYIIRFGVQLLRGKLLTILSYNLDLPLMLGYYEHLTSLPINFFETRKTGEILSRFNNLSEIRDALSNGALTIMVDVVSMIVCAIVLFNQNHSLFLVAASILIAYILVSALYIKPLAKMNQDAMEKSAIFNSFLKESVDAMETVKSAQAEDIVKVKTDTLFRDFLNTGIKGSMLSLSKDSIVEIITSMGTLCLLLLGAVGILRGNITAGELVAFSSLLNYFLDPVQSLVGLQDNIQTALIAAQRVNDYLDLQSEKLDGVVPVEENIRDITFDNVNFRYGNRNLVLNGMQFHLREGERIGLVGESGSGKSTTVKLLMGMYMPESGTISVNGIPIDQLSLKWLRERTAYVSQNVAFFSGSVRDNLVLGLPAERIPANDEITKVLYDCCCDFIFDLPFGIDSMLEENAVNLSGGQRQRLALVRAILRNPQLLILDEATSALDTVTEARIQEAIRNLVPNACVVMVAHRMSTVTGCTILVLDHGQVIEDGSHSELLKCGGKYASLWNKQQCA